MYPSESTRLSGYEGEAGRVVRCCDYIDLSARTVDIRRKNDLLTAIWLALEEKSGRSGEVRRWDNAISL
jgi:hypothetical protein